MGFLALCVMFFLPAGTLAYWQAWVYLAILFIPMFCVLVYLVKNQPELLARRMRTKEQEPQQKRIIGLSFIPFLLAFILPGLDKRYGWSQTPVPVIIVMDVIVLLGYGIVFLVFRENQYASRIVEVESNQKVISSGLYSIIRHPMYLGSLMLYIFSPLALGSYWALIPAIFIVPVIVARIKTRKPFLNETCRGIGSICRRHVIV